MLTTQANKKCYFELIIIIDIILLILFWYYDALCEPCIDKSDCPPCLSKEQYFIIYFGGAVNLIMLLFCYYKNKDK